MSAGVCLCAVSCPLHTQIALCKLFQFVFLKHYNLKILEIACTFLDKVGLKVGLGLRFSTEETSCVSLKLDPYLTYYMISQCWAIVSWAFSKGNPLLLCSCVWSSPLCTEVFHQAPCTFSMFTQVTGMHRPTKGVFLDCTVTLLCLSVENLVSLSIYHKVVCYLYPSHSLWNTIPPCLAFLSSQLHCCFPSWGTIIAVTVKVEKKLYDLPTPNRKKWYPVEVSPAETKAVNFTDT